MLSGSTDGAQSRRSQRQKILRSQSMTKRKYTPCNNRAWSAWNETKRESPLDQKDNQGSNPSTDQLQRHGPAFPWCVRPDVVPAREAPLIGDGSDMQQNGITEGE